VTALLLALACAKAPQKPPMVGATEQALRACATNEIVVYRNQLATRVSEPSRVALFTRYERAIASWAVCQIVRGRTDWSIPPLADEPSATILRAARAPLGTAERIRAYAATRDVLPEAVAVLALQDLERLVVAAAAEPRRLPTLTAYVCAPTPDGASLCKGGEGGEGGGGSGALGLAGLEALRALAFPSVDPRHSLTVSLREPVQESWDAIARHRIPLAQTAPLPLDALPVGSGTPLAAPIGPPYLLVGERGGLWLAGPTIALTPESMSIDLATPRESDWPDEVPAGPYVWVDRALPASTLAAAIDGRRWAHAVLVGVDANGALVALDARLPALLRVEPEDGESVVLPPRASVQDLVRLGKPPVRAVLVAPPPR
jgi:hypothetical protein